MLKQILLNYQEFNSIDELDEADAELLLAARNAVKFAYVPYSQFQVGAAARLTSGKVFQGGNQENASYPVCMCAEQTLVMSLVNEVSTNNRIESLAVSYLAPNGSSDTPVSPCGKCRQFLSEFELRSKHPIRIIMSGMTGVVRVVDSVAELLPLAFSAEDMK
jgi:cytidine deaminase